MKVTILNYPRKFDRYREIFVSYNLFDTNSIKAIKEINFRRFILIFHRLF